MEQTTGQWHIVCTSTCPRDAAHSTSTVVVLLGRSGFANVANRRKKHIAAYQEVAWFSLPLEQEGGCLGTSKKDGEWRSQQTPRDAASVCDARL